MAGTHIPAKQLQTVGSTLDELKSRLLGRETGWCSGDRTLYYKDGDELRPVGEEILVLMYRDPTEGILDADYDKLAGGQYKTAILMYGTEDTQSIATLAAITPTISFASLNDSLKKIFVFSVGAASSSGRHSVSQSEISLEGGWRDALNKETDERKTADSDLKKSIEKSESAIGSLGRQINEETTRATESEKANADAIESVANRLDSEFETKADAKSKSETYGLLMRANGKNTLQFYRPSLG